MIFVTVPSMASVFNEYALKSQYDTSIYLQTILKNSFHHFAKVKDEQQNGVVERLDVHDNHRVLWNMCLDHPLFAKQLMLKQSCSVVIQRLCFSDIPIPPTDVFYINS